MTHAQTAEEAIKQPCSITIIGTEKDTLCQTVRFGFRIGAEHDPQKRESTPEQPFPPMSAAEAEYFIALLYATAMTIRRHYSYA